MNNVAVETPATDRSGPVAVIGAGPVGLAAAASMTQRGIDALVFEAGVRVGTHVAEWGHVRLFTPWSMNIDPVAGEMLREAGWEEPDADGYPTGAAWREGYLEPLAELPQIAATLRLQSRVVGVARADAGKTGGSEREATPFRLRVDRRGRTEEVEAKAVIDASGTWSTPNPLGGSGLRAIGEAGASGHLRYGIPDVLGSERSRYWNRDVAVVGAGHSAQQVVRDLAELAVGAPAARVSWILRGPAPPSGGGAAGRDILPARAELGRTVERIVESANVDVVTGFSIRSIEHTDGTFTLVAGDRHAGPFDEIVAATGFQPDLELLRELQVDLDPRLEAPRGLAALIDPDVHSCRTVPVHGWRELEHPEPGLWVVGMKSYGRAPTFLAGTGYAQVQSVVSRLVHDRSSETAARELPEGPACRSVVDAGDCCAPAEIGTPEPAAASAPAPTGGCCPG